MAESTYNDPHSSDIVISFGYDISGEVEGDDALDQIYGSIYVQRLIRIHIVFVNLHA